MEQDLVQVVQLPVALEAGPDAGVQPGRPVRLAGLGQRLRGRGHARGDLAGELLLQREHQVFLGREVQVEQALGHPGPLGDVVQRGRRDALGQEQRPGSGQEFGAALFGGLGSGHGARLRPSPVFGWVGSWAAGGRQPSRAGGSPGGRPPGKKPRLLIDLSPLRRSRDLRHLVWGELVSVLGNQLTTVAVPYQVYQLTRSSLVVGLVSITQLFLLPALAAGFSGLDSAGRNAIVPNLVRRSEVSTANSIFQALFQFGLVAGPALAGLLLAGEGARRPGLHSIVEGLRFVRGRQAIQGAYLIDINAMVFGMPRALFPALALTRFGGGASTLGFLYAAPGAGALVGALTTGWVSRIERQGLAVILAVIGWGAAITCFGLVSWLPLALLLLALA